MTTITLTAPASTPAFGMLPSVHAHAIALCDASWPAATTGLPTNAVIYAFAQGAVAFETEKRGTTKGSSSWSSPGC